MRRGARLVRRSRIIRTGRTEAGPGLILSAMLAEPAGSTTALGDALGGGFYRDGLAARHDVGTDAAHRAGRPVRERVHGCAVQFSDRTAMVRCAGSVKTALDTGSQRGFAAALAAASIAGLAAPPSAPTAGLHAAALTRQCVSARPAPL